MAWQSVLPYVNCLVIVKAAFWRTVTFLTLKRYRSIIPVPGDMECTFCMIGGGCSKALRLSWELMMSLLLDCRMAMLCWDAE